LVAAASSGAGVHAVNANAAAAAIEVKDPYLVFFILTSPL
jgi:hypothetical protein